MCTKLVSLTKTEITHLYSVQIWTINVDLHLNAMSSKNMLMNVIY